MSRKFEAIREQAMKLPIEERGWLRDDLWASSRTARERQIDAAWEVEIERRLAEIEAGTAKLIPAEEVFRKLKEKYGARRSRSRKRA